MCVVFLCVSLFNHFYLHPSSLLLPPPSIHPSTGHAFINSKMIFFPFHSSSTTTPPAGRGRHSYDMSSFYISFCSSVHPLFPDETVIMAAGACGQTGWPPQLPWQPEQQLHHDGFLVDCLCVPSMSSALWLFVSTLSRAITGLFEMLNSVCISLFQSASGSIYLPLWWFCSCYFDAVFGLIVSLNSLITAPDGGINLH